MASDFPIQAVSGTAGAALRSFLADSGYDEAGLRARPELGELPSKRAGNVGFLREVTQEPTAQNVLVRLFLFGAAVESSLVESVLPPEIGSILRDAGLVLSEGQSIRATVMLTPAGRYIVAADPLWKMESAESSDVILWPNQTTRMLQSFAIREPSRATLDLGSGCGVISLLASEWSRQLAATDLNPRAAGFTAFNAALNAVDGVENFTGDTFEPLAGRTFDQILANPPFFVTPSSTQLYCENPMELDGYCRRVVRESAARLNEGGFLQMVFEWVQLEGEPWKERLAGWVDGLGCDAWILRTYAGGAAAYALQRMKSAYSPSPEAEIARFEEWMAYYKKLGVDQVHGGILAMRRRTGGNWLRIDEGSADFSEPFGGEVLELFANQDVLSAPDSEQRLLQCRPRLAPKARLDQTLSAQGGVWRTDSMKVSSGGGFASALATEPQVADFMARCDGARTLETMIGDLASSVKAPVEAVRTQVVAAVRRLAERRIVLL